MSGFNEHCISCGTLCDVDTLSNTICEECRRKLRAARPESDATIPIPHNALKPADQPFVRLANPSELTITVAGGSGSGKTVVLTLLTPKEIIVPFEIGDTFREINLEGQNAEPQRSKK